MKSRFYRLFFALIMVFMISINPIHAVVYSYDSGTSTATYQTTEPTSSDITNWTTGWGSTTVTGWDYVGTVNGASGVYLGNGWVIACAHEGVGVGSTYVLDGVSYSVTSVTTIEGTDIVLFQINSILDLPSLSISSSTPTIGQSVVMIGFGGGSESWGIDTISGIDQPVTPSGYSYVTTDFYSVSSGSQSYAITGDSGGAAFYYNTATGTWVLTGIMEAVGSSGSNNYTYFAQLSSYYSQISAITAIPENSTVHLFAWGYLLFLAMNITRKNIHQIR